MASVEATLGDGFRRLRRRRDLDVRLQHYERRRMWGLKDPLALRYFQLNDEEFWIFERLDGRTDPIEIRAQFERRFAPRRLELETLRGFLRQLYREGLLLADQPGQGEALFERRTKARSAAGLGGWMNLLTVRFRGFDPEPALRRAYPWVRPFFAPAFAALIVLFVFAAAALVVTHWREFTHRLPTQETLLHPANIVWFLVTLAGIKLLHEIGHAFACKHYGGECHEMGLMLFCGLPSLYCNVSDAWMFPDKRARIAVGAAGIAVELVLAAAATFIWWFTEPGRLHTLCLVVMCVATVNTLLLNGNPLLRYDGYYVLADYVEIPNLSREAGDVWRKGAAWLGGNDVDPASPSSHDAGSSTARTATLATYAAASSVYSWMVLCGVLWLLNDWSRPVGLQILAQLLTVGALLGAALGPAATLGRALHTSSELGRSRRRRRLGFAAVVVAAPAVAGFTVPLPRSVEVTGILRPADAQSVFVTQPGRLEMIVAPQTEVRAGDVIARLRNDELNQAVARARAEHDRLAGDLELLERLQATPGVRSVDLKTARQAAADAKEFLERSLENQRRLTLTAPSDGVVVPAVEQSEHRTTVSTANEPWRGSLFDSENRGAFLEVGTPLCVVARGDHRVELVAVVAETAAMDVFAPQRAEALVHAAAGRTASGEVLETSVVAREELPEALVRGLGEGDDPNAGRTHCAVRISLDAPRADVTFDQSVPIKIHVADETLFAKLRRVVAQTFRH